MLSKEFSLMTRVIFMEITDDLDNLGYGYAMTTHEDISQRGLSYFFG